MAKSLRNKLAHMALCCTVVTSTVGQVAPAFAQNDGDIAVKQETVAENTTTSSAVKVNTESVDNETVVEDTTTSDSVGGSTESVTNDNTVVKDDMVAENLTTSSAIAFSMESVQDPWEEAVANATHHASINVYNAEKDEDSMAAGFFTKEDVPMEIVDGKVVLKLRVQKDPLGIENALQKLEQKNADGTYEELPLQYADDAEIRYLVAEAEITDIEKGIVLKTHINTGFMNMSPELRILLTEETIAYVKAQAPVVPTISSTDETAFGAADGTITVSTEGGSGSYEYTIDGGSTWITSNVFEGLEPGTYKVAIRDANNVTNVSNFNDVVIAAMPQDPWEKAVAEATHHASIKVYNADKDEDSMAAGFFTKEDVPMEIVDGKVVLKLRVQKDPLGIENALQKLEKKNADGTYEELPLQYADDAGIRYLVAEAEITDIETGIVLKTHINTGFMNMSPELRILLTEETIAYVKAQAPVVPSISTTDETAFGAADGTITVSAEGGSGSYEYTIDGGNTWSTDNAFTSLVPGTYKVAVRDADNVTNVSDFNDVVISAIPEYSVGIQVLQATADMPSDVAEFFKQENVELIFKEGKAYLRLQISKDGMGTKDVIKALALKVGEEFVNLDLKYLDDESVRYVIAEVPLSNANEEIILNVNVVVNVNTYRIALTNTLSMDQNYPLRIKLTDESVKAIASLAPQLNPVSMSVVEDNGTIEIKAASGSGNYEYTVDGGTTWSTSNVFKNLEAGIYKVAVRDVKNTANVSAFQAVEIKTVVIDNGNLQDGYYAVDIDVLHETNDAPSMASEFFNKSGLPLRVQNGIAYLTIQVRKDGMGMTDVIESLEQRIEGAYKGLSLQYKDDSSKRYILTEIKFNSLDDIAYMKCGIVPMQGMKPVLRIRLDKDSLKQGAGSIDTNFKSDEISTITKVEAENGKVKVYLNAANEKLQAEHFKGKVYLNDDANGTELKLKDFKMENEVITFTYDEVKAVEKDQKVAIGIILNGAETKSDAFTVKGIAAQVENVVSVITLKEDAKQIKYIKGYKDGTFKPNSKVTKAEALSMLSLLVEGVQNEYYKANISILHATKDEASMAGQFFKNAGVKVRKQGDKYFVELEIANEGLGFTDIITAIDQKVGDEYKSLTVQKSQDLKKAYVIVEVTNLDEAIVLKTGIAPMGDIAPELRVVVDTKSLEESSFETSYTDIDMWAKDAITLFEEAGVIGGNGEEVFNPNQAITRAEFVKIIAQVAGLEGTESYTHGFKDLDGHACESYIQAATEAGYINGYVDGTFKPEGTLTRAEAVKVINKLVGHTEETNQDVTNLFSDLSSNHWAYDEILKVVEF